MPRELQAPHTNNLWNSNKKPAGWRVFVLQTTENYRTY
jgi:hypothetical protein